MVPDVEKVSSEFKPHVFANRKGLAQRDVPVLVAGTAHHVSGFVSISAGNQIAGKGTGVVERAGHAGFAVGVANHVWPRTIERDRAATIGVGTVHEGITDSEPVAGRSGGDTGDLPVSDQLIQK